MLKSSVIEGTNIVEATYDGGLSSDEMDEVRQKLNTTAQAATGNNARLLIVIGEVDVGRIEPEAAWKDLKAIGDLDQVDRMALVTDQGWVDKLTGLAGSLVSTEIEVYSSDKRDEALVWLKD